MAKTITKAELLEKIRKNGSTTQVFFTNTGHKLSLKEHRFINSFMSNGDTAIAAKDAGFEIKKEGETYAKIGNRVLSRDYIYEELMFKLEEADKAAIADTTEIMQYFTGVMRGEIKDQFNLDAPLSERTSAAKELAKRVIDIPAKATEADKAIKIELDWKRD